MKAKVAVVGGGISGLSFAHYSSLIGAEVIVFEKNKRAGGCIESYPLNLNYFAELGGHTLTYKYNTVIDIISHYQNLDKLVSKPNLKFELVENGRTFPVVSRLSFFDLISSIPNIRKTTKEGLSVKEYYSSVLGAKNYKQLLHYAFQAILCQDPDQYPADMLFRKRSANKSFPKNFTLQEGITQLLDMIISNPAIEFKSDTSVTAISINSKGLYELWSGSEILSEVKYLNLSCPPNVAANFLKQIEPELAEVLGTFKVTEVDSILVTSDNQKAFANKKKSFIGLEEPFYSAIFHLVNGVKYWVFHFKSQTCDTEEKKSVVANILNVNQAEIKVLHEKKSILPALGIDDTRKIEYIKKYLEAKPLFLSTNYIDGLAIEDCCLRGRKEAERLNSLIIKKS